MFKNIVTSAKIYEISMGQTVKGQFQHPVSFFITIQLIGIIGLCQEILNTNLILYFRLLLVKISLICPNWEANQNKI